MSEAPAPRTIGLAPESVPSDEELLRWHQCGDDTAFRELVTRHHGWVHGLLLSRTGCPDTANDLTQDVFLRAFRGSPSFRFRSRFTTWLFSITQNVRRGHAVRASRERSRRAPSPRPVPGAAEPPDALASVADGRPGPEQTACDRERAAHLRLAMKDLPAGQERALVLVKILGLSVAAAARTLGVAEGTVKTWIHRGRLALAQALADGDTP